VAKNRENKEERLRKAREADKKEEKVRKKAVFRLHAAVALEIEAAKEQNEILENIRITSQPLQSMIRTRRLLSTICYLSRPRR
jgi:hypothetical protein